MDMRKLGRSDLSIAPLMLGGNVFGWTADQATSFAILDAFVDAGFNAVDTGGESETVLGAWIKASGKRDRIVLATKLGMDMGGEDKGLSAAYMVRAVEASLKRLQTDHIDLYQSHRDDTETPLDETLEAYGRLVSQGKVRVIGASNYDAARLGEALKVSAANHAPRYETLQPLYNLYDRAGFEGPLRDLCIAEDVGVISFYGLASGFLTGKYRTEADFSKSPRGMGQKRYLNDRGLKILAGLDKVSAAHGATNAQVALAWLIAQPGVTAPIVSATSLAQLTDILGAARLKLTAEDMGVLEAASAVE
jgi:aryl-alcohol dehydrogenase-like predicted oxidoreductase